MTEPEVTNRGNVRPSAALCVRCGYRFGGGVTVTANSLTCPECGHVNRLEFASLEPARRRLARLRRGRRLVRWGVLLGLLLGGVAMLLRTCESVGPLRFSPAEVNSGI